MAKPTRAAKVPKSARKRRRDDDADVSLPGFDEVGYMEKEVHSAKASITLIILAIPLALGLFALTISGVAIVAFFLGLGVTFLIPRILAWLPWPKIDVSHFKRGDWISHGGTFFFSWLAFWILLLNVPFVDLTTPVIAAVTVNGQTVVAGTQNNVPLNGTVTVQATVWDNVEVSSVTLTANGNTYDFTSTGDVTWTVNPPWTTPQTINSVTVQAEDRAGHSVVFVFDLTLTP